MKITKTQFGRLMKKLGAKFGFAYYNSFQCCNTCFTANLEDAKVEKYIYLKYCNKGMNFEKPGDFAKHKNWYIAYSHNLFSELATIFSELKADLDVVGVEIILPEDHGTTIILSDKRVMPNA
jgi:hypothetical protein